MPSLKYKCQVQTHCNVCIYSAHFSFSPVPNDPHFLWDYLSLGSKPLIVKVRQSKLTYWYLAIPAIVSRRRLSQDFEPMQCQLPWRDTGQSLELKLFWLWLQSGGGGRTTYGHIYGMEVMANHKCAGSASTRRPFVEFYCQAINTSVKFPTHYNVCIYCAFNIIFSFSTMAINYIFQESEKEKKLHRSGST